MEIPEFYTFLDEAGTTDNPIIFECFRIKSVRYETGINLLLARINPTFIRRNGNKYNMLLFLNRDANDSLSPISIWPIKVYVLIPLIENIDAKDKIMGNECLNIAWAELYQYEDSARHEAFSGSDMY